MRDVFNVKRSADSDDVLKAVNGQWVPSITFDADGDLEDRDSGKVVLIGANGVDVTLPTAAEGLNFTFILKADYDTAVCTIVQASASEDFYGVVIDGTTGTSGDAAAASNTKIQFGTASLKGDRVELWSDGVGWYAKAICKADNGITFEN